MNKHFAVLLLAGLVAMSTSARGAIVTYDYNFEFSGASPPAGAAPWLRVVFNDFGGVGSVDMTFTALNLVGTEFVRFAMFNLDPALAPTSLIFSAPVKTGVFSDPIVSTGVNAFQADGDGLFDIQLQFDQSPPANRFDAGDSVKYTITGIAGLTANSFNFNSAPGGGAGSFPVAAHVQGIGPGGGLSGWVAPEPGLLSLLALAVVPLVRPGRKHS